MAASFSWRILRPQKTRNSILLGLTVTFFLFFLLIYEREESIQTITSQSSQGVKYSLAFREKIAPNQTLTVVLLHSDALDSSVWEELETIDILYKAGYRVIAIDLPGHGKSNSKTPPNDIYDRAVLLNTVLKQLRATESVLVAPSMSGTYALPVVVRGSLKLRGFVPISPYGYEQFHKGEYSTLKIPTLIMYGLGDQKYGETSASLLQMIPDSTVHVIKDASHACYLQNPQEFHEVLLKFLRDVEHGTFESIKEEQLLKKDTYR